MPDARDLQLVDGFANAFPAGGFTGVGDDVQTGVTRARIRFVEEMRREFFFEPAEADPDDQAAALTAQREIENRTLRVRVFARDVGDELHARTRDRLSPFDTLRERIEDLRRTQTAQMKRHADEAFAITNILTRLVDVELRDH